MTRLLKSRAALALCAVACLLIFSAPRASADSISYLLTDSNLGAGFPGPYAEVTVDLLDSTHAQFTFDSFTSGGFIYLMADGGAVGVNVNATSWTLGTVTGTNSIAGFTPGPYSNGGAGNEDGWGNFKQTINSFDGFDNSATKITFTITNTSGTWSNAANVTTGNNDGNILAIHGFACAEPGCSPTSGAAKTGFASKAEVVPEPASMALMGTFLIGAYGVLRRKLKMVV